MSSTGSFFRPRPGAAARAATMKSEGGSRAARAPLRRVGPAVSAVASGAIGFGSALYFGTFLGAHGEHGHTAAQFGLAALGLCVVTAWASLEAYTAVATPVTAEDDDGDYEAPLLLKTTPKTEAPPPTAGEPPPPVVDGAADVQKHGEVLPVLKGLRSASEFALIMALAYACDRTSLASSGPKWQSPRAFWGVWLVICVAALCTLKRNQRPKVLAREQTEEWKGWMQLMFLLYHYFAEAELYNAIRVYIAAYVWMTGFGNYLFYDKTRNFGVVRVVQTLFRLNFFVFFCCLVLRNEYVLYYICPMHTLFTLVVWLALRVSTAQRRWLTIGSTLLATYALYDVDAVFRVAFGWRPLRDLLAFHDPLHPEFSKDELHEWHFRSGLDRFVWIFGMASAALVPTLETFLQRLDDDQNGGPLGRLLSRLAVVAGCLALGGIWTKTVYLRDKYAYNELHPYTSWLPIALYVLLRNLLPTLRAYSLHLFAFLGKITLETYILQFHVWMHSTGLNGSPKALLVVVPNHFWLNFAIVSAFYLYLSHRVFHITVELKDVLIPTDPPLLYRRAALALGIGAAFYLLGWACEAHWAGPQLEAAAVASS